MIQRIQSKSPTAHHLPKNNKNIEIEASAQSVNISKSGRAAVEEHPHVSRLRQNNGLWLQNTRIFALIL